MVDQLVASARRTLESVLVKLGLDPSSLLRSETDVLVVYALRRGSADVVVSVGHRGDVAYARVAAPVVVPPADSAARMRLYERLLELNAQGLGNAAFGLFEGRVVALSERPIQGLDASELEQMITHLAAVADSFDDRLADEFARPAERTQEQRSPGLGADSRLDSEDAASDRNAQAERTLLSGSPGKPGERGAKRAPDA